ncbi:MAG TPA: TerC family protein [Limnochordia bacterium]|nr:TerC family protein [Limnochordia bacterium]
MPLHFTDPAVWATIASIIGVDLLLSGDNAVVIALASRRLGQADRRKALIFGTLGAVALLITSASLVSLLIRIPYVQALGGALLAWISLKLLVEGEAEELDAAPTLGAAIRTIILADLVMSFDNMIAVAGTAHGDPRLIALGLVVSIPIIVIGGSTIGQAMRKVRLIPYLGAAFLAWTSGHMIAGDRAFDHLIADHIALIGPIAESLAVVVLGNVLVRRRLQRARVEESAK